MSDEVGLVVGITTDGMEKAASDINDVADGVDRLVSSQEELAKSSEKVASSEEEWAKARTEQRRASYEATKQRNAEAAKEMEALNIRLKQEESLKKAREARDSKRFVQEGLARDAGATEAQILAMRSMSKATKSAGEETSRFGAKAKAVNAIMFEFSRRVQSISPALGTVSRVMQRMGLIQQALAGIVVTTTAVFAGITVAILAAAAALTVYLAKMAMAREQSEIPLRMVTGGGESGASAMLMDFNEVNPIGMEAAQAAFIQLQRVGIEPTMKLMQQLADIGAHTGDVMGGMKAAVEGLTGAYRTGHADAGLFNSLEAKGIPILEAGSIAMGTTAEGLMAMAAAGQIGRKELTAIYEQLAKMSKGDAAEYFDTLGYKFIQLKTVIENFFKKVADPAALGPLKELFDELIETMKEFFTDDRATTWANVFVKAISGVALGIQTVFQIIPNTIDLVILQMSEKLLSFLVDVENKYHKIRAAMGFDESAWQEQQANRQTQITLNQTRTKGGLAPSFVPGTDLQLQLDAFREESAVAKGVLEENFGQWLRYYEGLLTGYAPGAHGGTGTNPPPIVGGPQRRANWMSTGTGFLTNQYDAWAATNRTPALEFGQEDRAAMGMQEWMGAQQSGKAEEFALSLDSVAESAGDLGLRLDDAMGSTLALNGMFLSAMATNDDYENSVRQAADSLIGMKVSAAQMYDVLVKAGNPAQDVLEALMKLQPNNDTGIFSPGMVVNFSQIAALAEQFKMNFLDMPGLIADSDEGIAQMWKDMFKLVGLQKSSNQLWAEAVTGAGNAFSQGLSAMMGGAGPSAMGDSFMNFFTGLGSSSAQGFVDEFTWVFSSVMSGDGELGQGLAFLFSKDGPLMEKLQSPDGLFAGLGLVMGGAQQQNKWVGGIMGAIGGAMSGAAMSGMMSGAALGTAGFPVVGTIIGAVIGGVIGYLGSRGGEKTPWTTASVRMGGGTTIRTGNQGLTDAEHTAIEKDITQMYRDYEMMFREILRMFRDPKLFDLLGREVFVNLQHANDMTAEDLEKWLQDVRFPADFQQRYGPAIKEGLRGLGMMDDAIEAVFKTIASLPGADRVAGLATVVNAMLTIKTMMDFDWGEMSRITDQSSQEAFNEFVVDATEEIDALTQGWQNMDLVERASDIERIGEIWSSIAQEFLNQLVEIRNFQDQITADFKSMRDSLNESVMTDSEYWDHLESEYNRIMTEISQTTDPQELQDLYNELLSVLGNGMSMFTPEMLLEKVPGLDIDWLTWWNQTLDAAEAGAAAAAAAIEADLQARYDVWYAHMEQIGIGFQTIVDSGEPIPQVFEDIVASGDYLVAFFRSIPLNQDPATDQGFGTAGGYTGTITGTAYYDPATGLIFYPSSSGGNKSATTGPIGPTGEGSGASAAAMSITSGVSVQNNIQVVLEGSLAALKPLIKASVREMTTPATIKRGPLN